ncbi:MAG: type III secretion system export apparatus subunit SctU [Rubrivivax sp.]
MADKNDGGDKTERPTPKRLEDARKKGDVAKSREVTGVVVLAMWLALGALALGFGTSRLVALWDSLFTIIGRGWLDTGFAGAARALGAQAAEAAVLLVAMLMVPAAVLGLLTDFLQAGPVLTFEKIKPKLEHMNPVEGIKRMFTLDSLIELVKSAAKTALLALIGWLVVRSALPEMVELARTTSLRPGAISELIWHLTVRLLTWTVALFAGVALLDASYQRWSFTKKMRMSLRDIRQESKESEGDPYIKQQRRQTAQEWSQHGAQQAAAQASVLVVNPTHIAIAIEYDKETRPVPTIAAKGEDHVARAMRHAAEQAGVPIVRNIPLARDLLARAEIGEIVPADLFDILAEVILWAREVRDEVDAQRAATSGSPQAIAAAAPSTENPRRRCTAPGEDLTHYPESKWNRSS